MSDEDRNFDAVFTSPEGGRIMVDGKTYDASLKFEFQGVPIIETTAVPHDTVIAFKMNEPVKAEFTVDLSEEDYQAVIGRWKAEELVGLFTVTRTVVEADPLAPWGRTRFLSTWADWKDFACAARKAVGYEFRRAAGRQRSQTVTLTNSRVMYSGLVS